VSLCYAAQEIEEMAPTCQSVQLFSHTECGCVAVTCPSEEEPRTEKPITTLPGTVEKIIKSRDPDEPEKGQIAVEGAEELYREIRIENTLQDEDGKDVALKQGAQVDVTTEAAGLVSRSSGAGACK
jgi:hypothetical protein